MNANASTSNSTSQPGLQEIRFTRNAQAAHFFFLALILACLGIGLYCLSLDLWKTQEPLLQRGWYGLLTLPFVAGALWVGVHLARHAYMIFSPVGIELFPFFFPSKNMQVLYWNEIEDLRLTANEKMLEVTLLSEGEHKVFIALAPLRADSRALFAKTIDGIRAQRARGQAALDSGTE